LKQGRQYRPCPANAFVATEGTILFSDGDGSDRSLDDVGVRLDAAIVEKARQAAPMTDAQCRPLAFMLTGGHPRNRKRQLPFQKQLGESRQTRKGENPELDERLTLKPSSSRVSSQWKSRVKSRRKSTKRPQSYLLK